MKVVKVACGQAFSVALLDDGTLWGCGWVGLQSGQTFRGPLMTKIKKCLKLGRIKDVATTYDAIFVVNEKKELWGWGMNIWGNERGNGTWSELTKILDQVDQVATPFLAHGESARFALNDNGEAWAWGKNLYTPSVYDDKYLPKKVAENIISLAAMDQNVALIDRNHDLFIGGPNHYGQVGDGTTDNCETPKCVLHDAQQVEFGGNKIYCLARTGNGQLYGWGFDSGNMFEQKIGIFTERNTQNVVKQGPYNLLLHPQGIFENVIFETTGYGHILAITKEGALLSWGNNSHGQLGDGSDGNRYDPKPIISDAKYAKAGNACSFVSDISGQLWACGSNSSGQLGIGNQRTYSSFVKVQFNQ
jgi:alpha-tubulin suppressor-like RCC1 family protein